MAANFLKVLEAFDLNLCLTNLKRRGACRFGKPMRRALCIFRIFSRGWKTPNTLFFARLGFSIHEGTEGHHVGWPRVEVRNANIKRRCTLKTKRKFIFGQRKTR